MLRLSYQGKVRLKKWAVVLGILALVGLLVWFCWLIWVQRFVVYSRDGVAIAFDRSTTDLQFREPADDALRETVALDLFINDGSTPTQPVQEGLTQLAGAYISTSMLLDGLDSFQKELSLLEPGAAVLVDVKSIYGNFYYTTSMEGASQSSSIDSAQMDNLIASLDRGGFYLIARLPAFRDTAFALAHQSSGLPLSSGALWTDEDKCYWLNPESSVVRTNLLAICRELQALGFDEVVFSDFDIPDSSRIVYPSDRPDSEILLETAQVLVDTFAGENFTVSFQAGNGFTLPTGQTRLYLEGIAPESLATVYGTLTAPEPEIQVVFLADTRDTRYEAYGYLRSLK